MTFPFQLDTLTPFTAVLFVLAVYRLTHMATMEDGPLDIALRVRTWIYDLTAEGSAWQRGIECPFCVSFWFTLVMLVVPWPVVMVLGLMGGAALIFDWRFKD